MEKQKRILITGGNGFIGSRTALACHEAGHLVCVYDIAPFLTKFPRGVWCANGDITDTNELYNTFISFRPTHVIHLAAQTSVEQSLVSPYGNAETNIMGSLLVIKYTKQFGCHLTFASSAGVYEDTIFKASINEFSKTNPTNPYATSKLAVEFYIQSILKNNYTIFRYSNVYGPGANGGVVKEFIEGIKNGKVLTVRDGTRDYIYISDVVAANLLAVEKEMTGVFNVSTNVGTSTFRVMQKILDILNTKATYDNQPLLDGEIRHSILDEYKLTVHGWLPRISLDEGLCKTIESYSD